VRAADAAEVAGSVEAAAEEGQHQVGDHVRHARVATSISRGLALTKWSNNVCAVI
jgi:hypothetical protein